MIDQPNSLENVETSVSGHAMSSFSFVWFLSLFLPFSITVISLNDWWEALMPLNLPVYALSLTGNCINPGLWLTADLRQIIGIIVNARVLNNGSAVTTSGGCRVRK